MNLQEVKSIHAYATPLMKTAVSLYLRSTNFYSVMWEYLNLPQPNSIKTYFVNIDNPGELHECENINKDTMETYFSYCYTLL